MRIDKGVVTLSIVILALVISAVPKSAQAVNEHGSLVVHVGEAIAYSGDSGAEDFSFDPTAGMGNEPLVWWVFLAFPEGSEVAARGLAFGHSFSSNLELREFGYDEINMLAIPDPDWMTRSGSGVGMGFAWDHDERLIELYWMQGYVTDEEPATYSLVPHPGHGGLIGTNDRRTTPIESYGTLGFNGAVGHNGLITAQIGGCCLPSGACIALDSEICAVWSGEFLGVGVSCESNNCVTTIAAELELTTESLILDQRGRGYVGHLVFRNAAEETGAVLEWSLPWANQPYSRSGSCLFGLSAEPAEGTLGPGESVRVVVQWDAGFVAQEPDCEVELTTNDPSNYSVLLPVQTALGLNDDWRALNGMPTVGAVHVLSGNPIRDDARFGIEVPQPGGARFDVHDASGRRVWSYEGVLPAGRHELIWPIDGEVAAGAYWGVLHTGAQVRSTHRMVVLR